MLHVAYCFDKAYRQHFGAAVTSLLCNGSHDGREIVVHVVCEDFDQQLTAQIAELRSLYQVKIREYPLKDDQLAAINALSHDPVAKHLSYAAYYRMWLVELLPAEVSRVLYLDSDTIVQMPICALYDTSLEGYAAAGTEDASQKWLAVHSIDLYLNSGVLLLNLDHWRKYNILSRCLAWMEENPGKNYLGDQCVINAALAGSLKRVDSHWNHYVTLDRSPEKIPEASILHYITRNKPWQAWYETERAKPYWKYLKRSPWRDALPDQPKSVEQLYKLAQFYRNAGEIEKAVVLFERVAQLQSQIIQRLQTAG